MFKPQVHRPHFVGTVFLPNKPCIPSSSRPSFSVRPWPQPQKKYRNNIRVGYFPSNIKAVAVASGTKTSISVEATAGVTLKSPNLLGGSLLLELVSAELDPQDKFSWLWDEEFSRQTLAGVNPCSIKLVSEWPLKSTLDPDVYGPPESAITTELVEREIKAFMTIDVALEQKKLFIIDYHDLFLPYVSKVRQMEGTTLYGSRALFFLTPDGTLKPLAIELTRPPIEGKPQWKQVFTPTSESTGRWLWRFAKVHFLAHDSGYHQLVSHWLRTHCVTEPYIIATNRQLSVMHPIYRLLHPHFRYTMHINALARESLINADGIIETSFSPGKYSVELSSVAYDQQWRFDKEALPADLINRGIAVEDPDAPHGLKLLIEDYPFANDGLVLWDALKQWVADYVNYYYKDANMVQSDPELQAWWTEIQTKGHEDKKDEPWWPNLQTPNDLIGIITTITWVASGHHSAVNFGQYAFAGYFPNRPSIARTNMPCEEPTEEGWQRFLDNPNSELLACFPSKLQATRIMATLDLLSEHSSDEEYLGKDRKLTWDEEPVIKEAFNRFSAKLEELERTIDDRNKDNSLKNRNGAGVVPYELLKGVPYSISI
uniref:Lipoxygenase n=1 Tax=Vitis vinifera TaxID=29760 RepID=F6GUC9_VITVI